MAITATIDEHEAVTLTYTRMNTTSNLGVPDAADFADDLYSTFELDQGDIYRDAYNVLVRPEGVTRRSAPPFVPDPMAAHRLRGRSIARLTCLLNLSGVNCP